ncbi:MAG: hypothetical protein E4H36_13575 [Spirochaetales bacterium]|nr:MAG: hypothetical protein E4H36_13575 [Spirochaetales bacterium]
MYAKTFQNGCDAEHDEALKEAVRWVNKGRPNRAPALSSFGTSLGLLTDDTGMKYIGRLYG